MYLSYPRFQGIIPQILGYDKPPSLIYTPLNGLLLQIIVMARMKKEERIRRMENAKLLYLNGITNVEELADRTGVTVKTMYTWINDGNWAKLQKNFVLTREEQMSKMLDELAEINASIQTKPEGERFADAKLAQVRRQLIKDIKDLETKALLPEVISALTQFLKFVRKHDLEKAKEYSKWVDSFIKSLLK